MGLTCETSTAQLCDFSFTRTVFSRHRLVGPGLNHTFLSPSYYAYNYPFIQTTAAALVVRAGAASSFALSLDACAFADNSGAGLWVFQDRLDSAANPLLLGEVAVSGSSFTGHTALPGGMPAATVCGARAVSLTGSVWRDNRMGAVALEVIQDLVTVDAVTMRDNSWNDATFNTFDLGMMDANAASSVVVTGEGVRRPAHQCLCVQVKTHIKRS